MTDWNIRLDSVQRSLRHLNLDGWLLYDFRRSNELACAFLEIPASTLLSRRFFYWIPMQGVPTKIVHRIENSALDHLPGQTLHYSSWKELEACLATMLKGSRSAAMEYSPRGVIPTISKVDAGTVELVRSFGIDVQSSADVLQTYTSVWTAEQLKTHVAAAKVLQSAVEAAWKFIADAISNGRHVGEIDVQCFILEEFKKNDCICDHSPICAVNAHSANPHYIPVASSSSEIRRGDFVLIDVWCKKNVPGAVYADITRVGVVAAQPTEKQNAIFAIVRQARDAAIDLIKQRLERGQTVRGYEVDQVCREVIVNAGYGDYFTHRTGHNIGERDHGHGANIDSYETQDYRLLLPGTCFSIEPGIYLPGEFGVRLEDDVYLDVDGKSLRLTPGMQYEIQLT